MRALYRWIVVLSFFAMGYASSGGARPPTDKESEASQSEADSDTKHKMEDFIGMTVAFIRRAADDVKAAGYTLIFTDIGPESLERDAPAVFRDLIKRSSGGGVQVRGFSRAAEKDGTFRDKQAREKGVGLWFVDIDEDAQSGSIISGWW